MKDERDKLLPSLLDPFRQVALSHQEILKLGIDVEWEFPSLSVLRGPHLKPDRTIVEVHLPPFEREDLAANPVLSEYRAAANLESPRL